MIRRVLAIATVLVWVCLLVTSHAWAEHDENGFHPILTVGQGGVENHYSAVKVSGPVYHYETPETNPDYAEERMNGHVWEGHGSEHLPCPGGIHWISNNKLLTISNCLEVPSSTTTTTTVPTTTIPPTTTSTTTTTVTSTTSTTTVVPSTTTTVVPTTTSLPPSTTAPPECLTDCDELPRTGPGDWVLPTTLAGLSLLALGTLTLRASRRLG